MYKRQGIDDCVKVNDFLSPALDELDPIQQSYCLEISSAGLVRELKKKMCIRDRVYIVKRYSAEFCRTEFVKQYNGRAFFVRSAAAQYKSAFFCNKPEQVIVVLGQFSRQFIACLLYTARCV